MSTTADHAPAESGVESAPVLLDAASTTRCRRRVHLEHDPSFVDAEPARAADDPGVAMRRADAAEHRAQLAERWAGALGDALVTVPKALTHRERVTRTLAAIASGASCVSTAELPPRDGRRGGAELLVRVPGGWTPVIVVRHRVTDAGSGALTTPIDTPEPGLAAPDDARRPRTVVRDAMRLAHLHRMLASAGLAPDGEGGQDGQNRGPVWGGIVGLDADAVLWQDLAAGPGGRSPLETYDRRFTDRLAVAVAARDRAGPLAEPTRITECRSCPWWPTCEAVLRSRDDVSLVVRGDAALWLRGHGVSTVRELASLDPSAAPPVTDAPDPAGDTDAAPTSATTDQTPPIDLTEAVALARAWRADLPLVRRVRRPAVPRGEVEVDVDMESLGEDGAYLWGALLSGADIGVEPGYRAFATWDPLPTRDEGRSFGEFWRWLDDVRARAAARGLGFRAFCYNEQAENRWLRSSAERFAGMPGVPHTEAVEEFIASDAWVDLFPLVSESFLCPHGKGLKRVAPVAGFAWQDPEAGGENSMRWYRAAVGLNLPGEVDAAATPDPTQRTRLLRYNEDDVRATWTLRTWMTSEQVLTVPFLADL